MTDFECGSVSVVESNWRHRLYLGRLALALTSLSSKLYKMGMSVIMFNDTVKIFVFEFSFLGLGLLLLLIHILTDNLI
jgi:hypothetical protein